MSSSRYYITTPIYYVNDRPHIGHAYATTASDVLARYHRLLGEEVYFLTGTDENSQKNLEAATKAGQPLQDYVDQMSAIWQTTWDELNISNDDFIRTTETRHLTGVAKFWQAVEASGDIYKGQYEGLYCVGCEAFYRETDLVDGLCPIHKRAPEILKEENYFFRLTKYRDKLLEYIEANPDFIEPVTRRNELINYVKDYMTDTSISRPNKGWGIAVPGDDSQVIYVWFDALINYLTAIGYGTDGKKFAKWWPANLHVIGKDILKFHGSLWPAMLMSAGLQPPQKVFAHGFFTTTGEKISKSLGNAIDPRDLAETYSLDALRYFLLREINFGGDGDFSIERVSARYDADLASGLGNTVSRILTLAVDQTNLQVGADLKTDFKKSWQEYHAAMSSNELSGALDVIWRALKTCDQYIDSKEPWKLRTEANRQTELQEIMGTLTEALRHLSLMLVPLLPETADKIMASLGSGSDKSRSLTEASQWGNCPDFKITKSDGLFPRLS